MARKKKEKSPYRGFTVEQIKIAEETCYFLIVGKSVFVYNNQMTFSKEDIDYHHTKVREFLQESANEATGAKRAEVIESLVSLRVMPLRVN